MTQTEITTPHKTAMDLMNRDVRTFSEETPVSEAARRLAEFGLEVVPVIDRAGRCVGVLSVSDLARWVGGRCQGQSPLPRTCAFQAKPRNIGGRESVQCLLAEGVCPFQRFEQTSDGKPAVVCTQPHCVPTDWQMVELESAPAVVRDVMTTEVVSVEPNTSIAEIARMMLDRGVHLLLVLDGDERPVGVVAINDLLRVLAQPDLIAPECHS